MNTLSLELEADGQVRPLEFMVRRAINLGYSGRDQAAVRAHIEELRAQGVPPPPSVPLVIPVAGRILSTDEEIEVLPGRTSGEAEVVFFLDGKEIYVGVGSDHTDRDLEALSIEKSKQICPNIVSRRVWRYRDVAERWDRLVLRSFVGKDKDSALTPYQDALLSRLLPPMVILDLAVSRAGTSEKNGLAVFSGTVPQLHGASSETSFMRCELLDEATGRQLSCSYAVRTLHAAT